MNTICLLLFEKWGPKQFTDRQINRYAKGLIDAINQKEKQIHGTALAPLNALYNNVCIYHFFLFFFLCVKKHIANYTYTKKNKNKK